MWQALSVIMDNRLKALIIATVLFVISSTSYLWRDVPNVEWYYVPFLWVAWPGWGLWNIHRFYRRKSMGVGLWSAEPSQEVSQKALASLCYLMIITPLFAGLAAEGKIPC